MTASTTEQAVPPRAENGAADGASGSGAAAADGSGPGPVVAGHQPEHLPYLGFLAKMLEADVFVIVDHVQFEKKGWQNRNRILGPQGEVMLTVPVRSSGRFDQPIEEVEIAPGDVWRRKHWRSMYAAYHRYAGFSRHGPFFEWLYDQPWERLVDLNLAVIHYLMRAYEIDRPLARSSALGLGDERKTGLLAALCRATGATAYLSGRGGAGYVDDDLLARQGLSSIYTTFRHPEYDQGRPGFVPGCSAVDLLFRHPESAPSLLRTSIVGRVGAGRPTTAPPPGPFSERALSPEATTP